MNRFMLISDREVLDYIADHPGSRRENIRRNVAPDASDTTTWRALKRLVEAGQLEVSGKGRAVSYTVAGSSVVRAHLQTPYNERPPVLYETDFLDAYIPNKTFYLPESDRQRLYRAGKFAGDPLPAGTYAKRYLGATPC